MRLKGMISRSRQKAGLKAKRQGCGFEKQFELLVLQAGAFPLNFPQGMRIVKNKFGQNVPLMLQTPCDYVLLQNGKTMLVDCKHVEKGKTFSYSRITQHQLNAFANAKRFGVPGGYVIKFAEYNEIKYFTFEQLDKLKPRESLNMLSGQDVRLAISTLIGS